MGLFGSKKAHNISEQMRLEQQKIAMEAAKQYQNQAVDLYANQQGLQAVNINSGIGTYVGGNSLGIAQTQVVTTANSPWVLNSAGSGVGYYTTSQAGSYTTAATIVGLPNGSSMAIVFTDANGVKHEMWVDVAYWNLLLQMSNHHVQRLANLPKTLPEPDFDLDEMAAAHELLESLEDGPRPEAT